MKHSYIYTGCFFNADEFLEKIKPYRNNPLDRTILYPHITFAYKPDEVDQSLFGADICVTITGYGNNSMNEGVSVYLSSGIPKLQRMIEKIEVPHITVSVAEGAEPFNTRELHFADISPIQILGKYGGYDKWRKVVLCKGGQ